MRSTVSVIAVVLFPLVLSVWASGLSGQLVPSSDGDVTAWGKPAKGLQAGLRCSRNMQIVRPGEQAELEVVVRNISDAPIEFTYLPPTRYWGTAEKSTVAVSAMYQGKGFPDTVHVQPGKELLLGRLALGHARPRDPKTSYAPRPELAAGKYQVGAENVNLGSGRIPGKSEWVLPTGYLDIELCDNK